MAHRLPTRARPKQATGGFFVISYFQLRAKG